ncbi:MAG TPA: hypothetical protein VKH15_15590 [Candidatus Acidoferrum sp.]|nr:hypothetical protein [Candidatus Acidoferrum sp.]
MSPAGNASNGTSMYMREAVLTPERRIWRAVLGQAYADAELTIWPDGSEPNARVFARSFLRADSLDDKAGLCLVCELADVPVDRVVLWARRQYSVAACVAA